MFIGNGLSASLEPPSKKEMFLAPLLMAVRYADDLGRSVWDFAVDLGELRALGATINDLRWLVARAMWSIVSNSLAPAVRHGGRFSRRGGQALRTGVASY